MKTSELGDLARNTNERPVLGPRGQVHFQVYEGQQDDVYQSLWMNRDSEDDWILKRKIKIPSPLNLKYMVA